MVAAVRDAAASHGLRCEVNSEPEEATRQAYILCRTFLPQALPCRFYDFTCTYRNDRDEIELLARTAHSFKASFKCHITDLQSNVCMREGGREGSRDGEVRILYGDRGIMSLRTSLMSWWLFSRVVNGFVYGNIHEYYDTSMSFLLIRELDHFQCLFSASAI